MLRCAPLLSAHSDAAGYDSFVDAAPLGTRLHSLAAGPPRTRSRAELPPQHAQGRLGLVVDAVDAPLPVGFEATCVARQRRDVVDVLVRGHMRVVLCAISFAVTAELVARRHADSIL